jgi:hypothetical protein
MLYINEDMENAANEHEDLPIDILRRIVWNAKYGTYCCNCEKQTNLDANPYRDVAYPDVKNMCQCSPLDFVLK